MRLSLLWCAPAVLLFSGCAPRLLTPKRPKGVPETAVWTEGAGGASWIDCRKPAADSRGFDCSIFTDHTGVLHAKGSFTPNFDPAHIALHYQSYDGGGRITLSDTTRLQADGFVDFPSGDGHGKKTGFRSGEPVGPDSTY